jgi:DNA-directed RNA polymerase subunit RPC12/RpoP
MPAADDDTEHQPPWADSEVQPLPESFDDLHAPERMPYVCSACGQEHEAELTGFLPLGDGQVQLNYRAVPCTNEPVVIRLASIEGGPVVGSADD